MTPLPDRLLALVDRAINNAMEGIGTMLEPDDVRDIKEAAAALSVAEGREAVAHRWKRDGEVVSPWFDGAPTDKQVKAMDDCAPIATWTYELAYSAPTTPQPGDGWIDRAAHAAVELLSTVLEGYAPERSEYGLGVKHLAWMACELAEKRIESPTKACRWLGYLQGALVTTGLSSLRAEKLRNQSSAAPSAKGVES